MRCLLLAALHGWCLCLCFVLFWAPALFGLCLSLPANAATLALAMHGGYSMPGCSDFIYRGREQASSSSLTLTAWPEGS